MTDTDILDAAKLKAVRLPEATTRLGDRPAHTVKSSVQLTASADAQTGLSAANQQANSGQNRGQHLGAGSAFTGTAPTDLAEQWIDILDMQDEKWTDQLARRIDRELKTGGKGLELEMNPRNLGSFEGQPLCHTGSDKCSFTDRNRGSGSNADGGRRTVSADAG